MQPMITGSPVSTMFPQTSATYGSPNDSFLPSYLLGCRSGMLSNAQTPSEDIVRTPLSSVRSAQRVKWSANLDSTNYYDVSSSPLDLDRQYGGTPKRPAEKSSSYVSLIGPPTASLNSSLFGQNNVLNGSSQGIIIGSDYRLDSLEDSQVGETESSNVVTIFGFTTEMLPFIFQQFGQCGVIMAHETANKCNWVHVKYESRIQTKRALDKNGRTFNDNMKIGVELCRDQKVIARLNQKASSVDVMNFGDTVNDSQSYLPACAGSPLSTLDLNSSRQNLDGSKPKSNMRSLTSYSATQDSSFNSENFLSRAKNYLLGR